MPHLAARPPTPPAAPSAPADAAQRILDAAERLFAANGLHATSTRLILRESGHLNQSALGYHFGDRLRLVAALLDRRNGVINDLRHRQLDALAAQGRDQDAAALVEALVRSVTDVVRQAPWGHDFVLVSVQVLLDPRLAQIEALLDASRRSAYARAVGLLRLALPALPEHTFDTRIRMLGLGLGTNLSKWLRAHGPVMEANLAGYDALVDQLIDFLTGGLLAPLPAPRAVARARAPRTGRAQPLP